MNINETTLGFSRGPTMPLKPNLPHRRFEDHARMTPDAIAVSHEEGQLTYSQLNSYANHFCHTLKTLDIGPDVVVALYMERCPELVIGTLATHKAGGACAYIEPANPDKRLQAMLAEINPRVILTTQKYRSKLQNIHASIVVMDALEHFEGNQNPPLLIEDPSTENLACVFFTSGSSGKPKAVMLPYGHYCEQQTSDSGTERHLLKTNSGTTFTRAEILRPLVSGQQLFIAPPGLEKDFQELACYIKKHNITHLISTPTALQVLLDLDNISLCHSLKSVTCSGENIPPQLKKDFLSRLNAELHIIYGCTEVPGAVSMKISKNTDHELLVSTGRPAPMMEVYVLDDEMQPVSIGSEGEVYLGGLMTSGYFNNPDLTEQKLVPHPYISGQRLFKSGDRGRWLPNGYLQVLGRSDNQIKIRGFRIEPGEIEAALLELPNVLHAVVMQREDVANNKFLTAYVVPRNNTNLQANDLKSTLKQLLPEYMIPRDFVLLSELPLTANGKVDRISLLRIQPDKVTHSDKSKPNDPFVRHLLAIWKNLLNVSSIDIHDNFFDLGGDSLLAVQMLNHIEKIFQKKLPLDFLWFHGGTIASIANALRNQYQFGDNPELVLIKKGSRQPLFVIHVRGGYLLDYYALARYLDPNQTVYGLQARGVFGNTAPDCSVKEIAANCIRAMQKIQPYGPYLIAGYSSGGVVAYEMMQQLNRNGETVAMLAMLDTYCPWVYQPHRWHKALKRLFRGKTHNMRNLIYSALLTTFGLNRYFKTTDVHKAHKYAQMTYRPRKTEQAIDFFIAEESTKGADHHLLGWLKWLKGPVRTYHFPASHSDLVKLPAVKNVAQTLQTCINTKNFTM